VLGAEVRYDGRHKRDSFIADDLARSVDLVSVCPEMEVGMGVPRESVHLVRAGQPEALRMRGVESGHDWTDRMNRFAEARADALADQELAGFIFKSKSPSCGLSGVKIDAPGGAPEDQPTLGRGLFAEALARRLPNLPLQDEARLGDAQLREDFLERVFAYAHLRALWRSQWTLAELIAFHTAHKMALLAHSTDGYRQVGRLVGVGRSLPRDELRARYEADFMRVLALPTSPGRHANVLMHLGGHLSDQLDDDQRRALLEAIEGHRLGRLPLSVPKTLLADHARRLATAYLLGQTYLCPPDDELRLRARA